MKLTITLLCICLTFVSVMAIDNKTKKLVNEIVMNPLALIFDGDGKKCDQLLGMLPYKMDIKKVKVMNLGLFQNADEIVTYLRKLIPKNYGPDYSLPWLFSKGQFLRGADDLEEREGHS